jgi:hypothetical protein
MCVSLTNTDLMTATAGTSELLQILGIREFLQYRPLYCLQYYAIYKYAVVTGVEIQVQGINQGAVEAQVIVGSVPHSDVSGLTSDRLKEMPGTTFALLGLPAGMARATIRKSFNATHLIGNRNDARYWIDVTQSASSTPVDSKEPVIVVALDNFSSNATVYNATALWKITYHIQFFDLLPPTSS